MFYNVNAMIVIKNKLIPFGRYTTINLFGIVFTKEEMTEKIINHERIHTIQMLELALVVSIIVLTLIVFFDISLWWFLIACPAYYVWYIVEYMWISIMHSKQVCAYRDVSFEEEAHANDDNLDYINNRKVFSWCKYLKSESNHNQSNKDCCN